MSQHSGYIQYRSLQYMGYNIATQTLAKANSLPYIRAKGIWNNVHTWMMCTNTCSPNGGAWPEYLLDVISVVSSQFVPCSLNIQCCKDWNSSGTEAKHGLTDRHIRNLFFTCNGNQGKAWVCGCGKKWRVTVSGCSNLVNLVQRQHPNEHNTEMQLEDSISVPNSRQLSAKMSKTSFKMINIYDIRGAWVYCTKFAAIHSLARMWCYMARQIWYNIIEENHGIHIGLSQVHGNQNCEIPLWQVCIDFRQLEHSRHSNRCGFSTLPRVKPCGVWEFVFGSLRLK